MRISDWSSDVCSSDLPAYIATGSLDLFFDENLDYARRLVAAGVSVDLHSYAGAIHAFNAIPDAALSQRFNAGLLAAAAAMAGPPRDRMAPADRMTTGTRTIYLVTLNLFQRPWPTVFLRPAPPSPSRHGS